MDQGILPSSQKPALGTYPEKLTPLFWYIIPTRCTSHRVYL